MFPSSGKIKVAPTLLGPLETANLKSLDEKTLDDGQSPKA
jgi:hypothetical protein